MKYRRYPSYWKLTANKLFDKNMYVFNIYFKMNQVKVNTAQVYSITMLKPPAGLEIGRKKRFVVGNFNK